MVIDTIHILLTCIQTIENVNCKNIFFPEPDFSDICNLLRLKHNTNCTPLSYSFLSPARDDYQHVVKTIEFDANTTLGIDEIEKREIVIITDNIALEEREFFTVNITAIPGIFPVAVQNFTATIEIDDNDGKQC